MHRSTHRASREATGRPHTRLVFDFQQDVLLDGGNRACPSSQKQKSDWRRRCGAFLKQSRGVPRGPYVSQPNCSPMETLQMENMKQCLILAGKLNHFLSGLIKKAQTCWVITKRSSPTCIPEAKSSIAIELFASRLPIETYLGPHLGYTEIND